MKNFLKGHSIRKGGNHCSTGLPIAPSCGDIFSINVSFTQMTIACAKMTEI